MPASPESSSRAIAASEFGFGPGWDQDLAARDDERLAAMLAGDAARLEAVYSADLRFGHSIGRVDTRAELIRVHAERTLTWSAIEYAERRFRPVGPGLALMEGRVLARGSDLGIVLNLDLVFLAVWWREAAGWKMLAWQSTQRPSPLLPMILPKSNRLSETQLAEVTAIVAEFGCRLQPIIGAVRTIYAIVGDERDELMINRLEGLDYIERIDRIQSPFKLMDRRSDLATHRITVGGVTLGEQLFVIAGQCTIDPKNPNYFYETAAAMQEAGAQVIRGGVWKPRTNPYTFQGDTKSLDILMEAHRRTGLPVDAEVMDERQLADALAAGVHMLQVGARNALNYSLLSAIGRAVAKRPGVVVLLKRSLHMGPLSEFISAAEYIASFGNPNVILCPRGTSPAPDGYRNHPDECITPLLKEKTWAPVVVDPSHSVGKAVYVPACALAAVAYGADGLCIEAHVSPSHGIGDDPKQALTPAVLAETIRQARALWQLRRAPLK